MKVLARIILHQLLFAVWLLAMWVLYCTPACTHPIEHLIAAPFAVLIPTAVIMRRLCSAPPLRALAGRATAVKDLDGSAHIAAWTWFVMRGHAGTARASRKRR